MVIFFDHPIGEPNGEDAVRHADNIAAAGEWMRWLGEITTAVILAPWHAYVIAGFSVPQRIVASVRAIERCDAYVHAGGTFAPHMRDNTKAAARLGVPIIDLTMYGVLPPELTEDVKLEVWQRFKRAFEKGPRRAWLPLLTAEDVEEFKRGRHGLYILGSPGEFDKCVAVMDRIVDRLEEYKE